MTIVKIQNNKKVRSVIYYHIELYKQKGKRKKIEKKKILPSFFFYFSTSKQLFYFRFVMV